MKKSVEIECDENLRFYVTASFGDKIFGAQVVLTNAERTAENFKTQSQGLVSSTRRTLLKNGIISE